MSFFLTTLGYGFHTSILRKLFQGNFLKIQLSPNSSSSSFFFEFVFLFNCTSKESPTTVQLHWEMGSSN